MERPNEYTDKKFIREKKNHSWSNFELRKIRSLRDQKVPVAIIIAKLGLEVKKTQVYNVIRMLNKNTKGKCFQCGNDLTPEDYEDQKNKRLKKCISCKEKNSSCKKAIRKSNIDRGKCACCGHTRPLKDKKTCMVCLSYTYRSRIADGFCGKCGDKPISEKSTALCDYCLETNRVAIKKIRARMVFI